MAAFGGDSIPKCDCRLDRCKICNPDPPIVIDCCYCHGDQAVGKIAKAMGFRPDIAFSRINKLEGAIACFCREELGNMNFESDQEAVDYILEFLDT